MQKKQSSIEPDRRKSTRTRLESNCSFSDAIEAQQQQLSFFVTISIVTTVTVPIPAVGIRGFGIGGAVVVISGKEKFFLVTFVTGDLIVAAFECLIET
ncbi:transmembrane protein, putative [Medicago truncatula]|uniref:Transmembrane protein, putative n=1 Tax=Medicago truncatula TaxID=3880 RepID=G7J347_MEDTR|nr:transmembrane protein, putative [Medicago truncatula]